MTKALAGSVFLKLCSVETPRGYQKEMKDAGEEKRGVDAKKP